MQTRYSKTFKIEAVKRALSRNYGTSVNDMAESLGIANSTLHGWIKAMKNKELREPSSRGGFEEKNPCQWTPEERFTAIIETSKLSEEEIAGYCRKKGIFPHHLKDWKADFIKSSKPESHKDKQETKRLKSEIKNLSTELRRKEKALAETAALLVLKKKVEGLWGINEED